MTDNNEKTFTLAEVREKEREAFVRGAALMGGDRSSAEALAHHPGYYPDPEPPEPERPTVEYEGAKYGISMDGKHVTSRAFDGAWYPYMKMERLLALASLLPRVPVTITEEQKDVPRDLIAALVRWSKAPSFTEADKIWWGEVCPAYEAALSAVAADLAQPVHACQHTAQN